MKRIFLIIPALSLALVMACEPDRRTAQREVYEDSGVGEIVESEEFDTAGVERTAAAGMEEETVEFVHTAAGGSMLEVELGQLALEKAESKEVKDFAQMMVNNHRQVNDKLQNVIQDNNLNLPQNLMEDHREKLEELRDLSGREFDEEYMRMMVDLHEKDIDKFERMREEVQDPELQRWIDNTLPTLRQHREEAQRIKEQVENQP